jgi:RNA-directed DNA polymerase
VKNAIEPIFERTFAETSYGFRPNKNAKQALKRVDKLLNAGKTWAVDCDIKSYFDTIPHDKLMNRVKEQIADTKVLKLIEQMLEQGIMEAHKEWNPTQGTPQGGVISPVLANIYLNELDHLLIRKGVHPTRYADDLVVLCDSEAEAIETLGYINGWMINNGLSLHPDKTKVIDLSQSNAEMDFLGYTFKRTGKGTLIRYPRQKSMKRYREAVKAITKRTSGIELSETIKRINRKARGWFNYFSDSIPNVFETMDGYTRRRLRAILLKREKRPGFGTGTAHRKWPNSFFADKGLFSMTTAHLAASYPARR